MDFVVTKRVKRNVVVGRAACGDKLKGSENKEKTKKRSTSSVEILASYRPYVARGRFVVLTVKEIIKVPIPQKSHFR